jgi:hypothetical protein
MLLWHDLGCPGRIGQISRKASNDLSLCTTVLQRRVLRSRQKRQSSIIALNSQTALLCARMKNSATSIANVALGSAAEPGSPKPRVQFSTSSGPSGLGYRLVGFDHSLFFNLSLRQRRIGFPERSGGEMASLCDICLHSPLTRRPSFNGSTSWRGTSSAGSSNGACSCSRPNPMRLGWHC